MVEERELSGQQQLEKVKEQGQKTAKTSFDEFSNALEILDNFGGFDLVSGTVKGSEDMDAANEATKTNFLKTDAHAEERKRLKNRLKNLSALLSEKDNVGDMVEACQEVSAASKQLLNQNVKNALDATLRLETNYKAVAAFFQNANGDKPVRNVTIMNAPLEQLSDLDNPRFRKLISEEFEGKYNRLDLSNHYSLLSVPGYLGGKQEIDEWARVCHENKVMLVTDFQNTSSPQETMKLFESGKFTGADAYKANAMVTCNWLVARGADLEAGEKTPLYIPPSTALAGRMHANNMAQVSAGKKFGVLRSIKGCRFDVKANDLADLGDKGLVPMVYEYGQVQAFSSKTLFNGTNLGLQTYSVVRTFDWLTKSMMDYLNRMLFQNISSNMEMDIHKEIARFLDKCKREKNIIEKFGQITVKRDPKQKDRVFINVHITPFFPAKNFILKLDGKGGEDPEWDVSITE